MVWRTKVTAHRDGNGLDLGIDPIDAVEENDLHPGELFHLKQKLVMKKCFFSGIETEVGNARGIENVNVTETGTILTVTGRETGNGIVPEVEEIVWNVNGNVTIENGNLKSKLRIFFPGGSTGRKPSSSELFFICIFFL